MMSRLYPCVYCTEDGYCKKYSDDEVMSWCVQGPCKDERPSNADKLRAMSDEELAEWIDEFWSSVWCPDDPPVDPETKRCLLHDGDCRLCILDWLKQEVKE